MSDKVRSFKFKTEVKQLLDILVHSLYTNREIFLRELISNASDALDKIRFELTSGGDVIDEKLPLEISITTDKDKNFLTITDTGVGMTEDEIIKNIGTIAKSGSADFLNKLSDEAKEKDISNIIGKFGVGFYSVFMAAKEVVITTKSYKQDEPAVQWKSDGLGSFKIIPFEGKQPRGTKIEIFLKDDAKEFIEKHTIESIIKKHSNFISFPIKIEGDKVNTVPALWREPKSNIKQKQYDEFYKFLTYDSEPPMDTIHVSIDAPVQFNGLMFIPKRSFDLFGVSKEDIGLDLYVKSVLIHHKNSDLLPEYFGFIKGMVDSSDIPLNISRETLQENRIVMKMSSILVKQALSYLEKKAKDKPEEYVEFWKAHGKVFKLGYSDYANHEKIADLLRFNSSANEDGEGLTSFAEYLERAKEDQKDIYYISGSSREALNSDPHLEIFKRKGIEVLYMYEPVDEFVMNGLAKYKKDYNLTPVEQADLGKLDKFENVEKEESEVEKLSDGEEAVFKKLMEKIKDILGDRVTEVRESKRLKDSASCLVNPDGDMTSHMQKIMHIINKDTSIPKKVFEVNKDHQLIRNILKIYKNDPKDPFIISTIEQLYESALLLEGYLADPHKLFNRIQDILLKSSDWHPGNKK
jgi:molecular chaperone HtpG